MKRYRISLLYSSNGSTRLPESGNANIVLFRIKGDAAGDWGAGGRVFTVPLRYCESTTHHDVVRPYLAVSNLT